MMLDFSMLSQPASRSREQVGTAGTREETGLLVLEGRGDTVGTGGDRAGSCPQLYPRCPQQGSSPGGSIHSESPLSPPVPTLTLDDLMEDEREDYEERAAILEFDGGLTRTSAERMALRCLTTARMRERRTGTVKRTGILGDLTSWDGVHGTSKSVPAGGA